MTSLNLAALVANARRDISDADRCVSLHITPATGTLHRRLREVTDALDALSTPPADDVREALATRLMEADGYRLARAAAERSGTLTVYRAKADEILTAFDVRPRGTVTESERLEYTVAAISDNGAITSLSGESTVVRDHLRGDLELYRQQQVEAGCDPELIIIAQRPIPKWARS